MKKILIASLFLSLGLFVGSPQHAHAVCLVSAGCTGQTVFPVNTIVVQGTDPQRLTATSAPAVDYITATSSTATSSLQKTSITGAISLLGEYFTNFTTYVRSLFSAGTGLSLSSGQFSLANTSVSAGSYTNANITVDAQGRITSAANGSAGSGSSGLATTTPWTAGQAAIVSDNGHVYGASTSTPAIGSVLTYSGTLGNFIGGSSGTFGIANNAITNGMLANSTIALSDSNSTLTIGGTPASLGGTLTATLNLGHANTWTALQQFSQASTSQLSALLATIGSTASTTIGADGKITTPGLTISGLATGLLKSTAGVVGVGTSGTDYAPATSGTSILKGNGSGGFSSAANGTDYTLVSAQTCTNQVITALTAAGGSTCSSVSNAMLSNSTISGIALGSNLNSLSHGSTLSGTSYNGSAAVSDWGINLANANAWTALQQFNANASTTGISSLQAWFGATASSTIDSGGKLTLPNVANALTIPALGTPAGTFIAADPSGHIIATSSSASASAGGSNKQIQFNDSGVFGGDSYLIWDKTTHRFGLGTSTPWTLFSLDGVNLGGNMPIFSIGSSTLSSFVVQPQQDIQVQTITLTSGTAWTVPNDWNNSNNTIEVVGGGAGGRAIDGGGGGGGAYAKVSNLSLTPGASVNIQVGSAGTAGAGADGGAGGDTWFNGTGATCAAQSVCAKGGGGTTGRTGGTGGQASASVGTVKYSGGNGGNSSGTDTGGGGGGGAAGSSGAGDNGSNTSGATGGGGGTGNNGTYSGGSASNGGGGGGGSIAIGGNSPGANGGIGGQYGGGGGGGNAPSGAGGVGNQGVIVIVYTPLRSSGIVGIASSSPIAALSIDVPTGMIAQMISTTINAVKYVIRELDTFGHLITGGPAPTANTCTGFAIMGSANDQNGTINMTSGTSCSFTFANSYPAASTVQCAITPISAASTVSASTTPTGVSVTFGTAQTRFSYQCVASQ